MFHGIFCLNMLLHKCMFVATLFVICDGFLVKGPSGPLVVSLGSSLVLPCYVDEPLPLNGLKVIWIRTDVNTPVHVYQDYESRPDAQYQDYKDRAHFFTDEIQHGNFSLRLENVRSEDKGFYRCKVYTEQESDETLIQIKAVEYLRVSGSDRPVSGSVGEDVTLNCSVESHIPPEHMEEVSWRKTNEDEKILFFEKNKTLPTNERYRDRVEFFTDEIHKGNFSFTLKSVRTEDKGIYICHANAGNFSANATAVVEQLGFSVLHTNILALCISAFGSALLLSIIYCRLQNDWMVPYLYIFLNFLPNIMMFVAFILWGISDGFLHDTIACSALFLLRPNMLFRAGPHEQIPCVISNKWMNYGIWSFIEYSVFTGIVYTVISPYILDSQNSTVFFICLISTTSFILILFLYMMFCTSGWKSYTTMSDILKAACLTLLSIMAFIIYLSVASGLLGAVIFTAGFIPLLASMVLHEEDTERRSGSCLAQKGKWLGVIIPVNTFMTFFYIGILMNHKDPIGWACVIGFLQIQWTLMDLTWTYNKSDCRGNTYVYLFGSVGVVLLSAFTLMTELMLRMWNGNRTIDLRIVLFPAESVFAFSLLILQVLTPGEAQAFKRQYGFVVMVSFFLILMTFLLFINYLQ